MKTCPYCKGHKVIMFDADNDLCQYCGKWFPAVEDVKSTTADASVLIKGFEKIIDIVQRYRKHDGETSIGNHIENECKEILANTQSLPESQESKGGEDDEPIWDEMLKCVMQGGYRTSLLHYLRCKYHITRK